MAHIREVIEIKAPPDTVFEILDAPEHFPEWISGVSNIRFLSSEKHGPNSAIELTLKFGVFQFKVRAKVVDYKKEYQFTSKARQGLSELTRLSLFLMVVPVLFGTLNMRSLQLLAESPIEWYSNAFLRGQPRDL
ncbi:MAG: SRPBCC family protein [Chloroflexi bacterium]|nr:SRPBCC family protein [Chloroflexota bacterium]